MDLYQTLAEIRKKPVKEKIGFIDSMRIIEYDLLVSNR